MVAEQKDDGVIPQPFGLQAIHEPSHFMIGELHGIQMIRDLVAYLRNIRILRGYRNGCGIDGRRTDGGQSFGDPTGTLAAGRLDLGEEGRALRD